MTIPLTGAGSVGVRLGHDFGRCADIFALQGGAATARVLSGASLATGITTIQTDYSAGAMPLPHVIDNVTTQITSWQNSGAAALLQQVQSLSAKTIIAMAALDQGLPETSTLTLTQALKYWILQMKGVSTFNSSVPSLGALTNGNPAPTGNPVLVGNIYDGNGYKLQYVYPETLTLKCTADSYSGGATAYREGYTLTGQPTIASALSYLWPGGTGASITLSAVDSAANNTAGNMLVNGAMTAFSTANYPDNWVIATGLAGTSVLNGTTSNAYVTGSGSIEYASDGSTLIDLYQPFNTTTSTSAGVGGTPATVAADTNYAVNFWIKMSATPVAGVLTVSLTDGSNVVLVDDAGNNVSFTKSLTAVSTSFVNVNGILRLPANPPTTVRLHIRISTAIDNSKNLFISGIAMSRLAALGTGWPSFALFSGNTKALAGAYPDNYTLAVSNTWGTFQQFFERMWGIRSLGLVIPNTTSSPTVADTLVV